ncbi:MAG: hypothetical protein OQK73_09775 [Gammaproteobacteria bacterium]|nr:hypothetical protein [Gammaproteobacteria bacterium]
MTSTRNNSYSAELNVSALLDSTCYLHNIDHCQLIETHISWVILTGQYACKIKQPRSKLTGY